MKALQRFRNWIGNLSGKKGDEAPPSAPEKPKTSLDEFIEVFTQLSDVPYFSPPGWIFNKQIYIGNAIAYFNSLLNDAKSAVFNTSYNIAVDLDAIDAEEDSSSEPAPTEIIYGNVNWAEGEADEHLALLELAKKRAKEGWIAPLMKTGGETAEAYERSLILEASKKPSKKKLSGKKKTKKAAKTRKNRKARK